MSRILQRELPPGLFALLALAEVALLWHLSGKSGGELSGRLPGPSGNLLHIAASAALALCLVRALGPRAALLWRGAFAGLHDRRGQLALLLVLGHGLLDEAHQHAVPGRTCSVIDIIVNLLGAVVVLAWPLAGAPGRPRSAWLAAAALALAIGFALAASRMELPGDDLYAHLLTNLGFVGASR